MLFSLYQNKQIKLIFLCVVSVITLFHRLNQSPLGYDDVFYAQRAKEMLLNSDWFFTKPTYGGELLFDNKPPMLYWFLCLSGKIFGFNNWSMRLFPGLFGFFTVIFVFFVVLKIFNSYELGFLSAFILNFTQQFIYYSRSATPETIFSLFFWISLISFFYGLQENKLIYFCIAGITTGFAIMTRQIFGFLIYLIILCYYFFYYKNIATFQNSKLIYKNLGISVLLTLLISLPWHSFMIYKYKGEFINSYFGVIVRHTLLRPSKWYEYVGKIIENYWPWLPFLIVGVIKLNKVRRDCIVDDIKTKNMWIFILISVIVYTSIIHIMKFKAVQYFVPMYIPFAVLSAYGILEIDKNNIVRPILMAIGTVFVILWLIFPIIPNTLDSNEFKNLSLSFAAIQKIDGDIITLDNAEFWHFSNGLLFYLDKKVKKLNETMFVNSILNNREKRYYILKKRDFYFLDKIYNIGNKIKIVSENKDSILFTNI